MQRIFSDKCHRHKPESILVLHIIESYLLCPSKVSLPLRIVAFVTLCDGYSVVLSNFNVNSIHKCIYIECTHGIHCILYCMHWPQHFAWFINNCQSRESTGERERKKDLTFEMKRIYMKHNINKSRLLLITSVCLAFSFFLFVSACNNTTLWHCTRVRIWYRCVIELDINARLASNPTRCSFNFKAKVIQCEQCIVLSRQKSSIIRIWLKCIDFWSYCLQNNRRPDRLDKDPSSFRATFVQWIIIRFFSFKLRWISGGKKTCDIHKLFASYLPPASVWDVIRRGAAWQWNGMKIIIVIL